MLPAAFSVAKAVLVKEWAEDIAVMASGCLVDVAVSRWAEDIGTTPSGCVVGALDSVWVDDKATDASGCLTAFVVKDCDDDIAQAPDWITPLDAADVKV